MNELTVRRGVIEKLTYKLIEVTDIVNDDVGEDLSFIELVIAFGSAQQILVREMERQKEE